MHFEVVTEHFPNFPDGDPGWKTANFFQTREEVAARYPLVRDLILISGIRKVTFEDEKTRTRTRVEKVGE